MEEVFVLFFSLKLFPAKGLLQFFLRVINLSTKELSRKCLTTVFKLNAIYSHSILVISQTEEIFMETAGQRLAECFPVRILEIQSCICLQ